MPRLQMSIALAIMLIFLLIVPSTFVYAVEQTDTERNSLLQLKAIIKYLERMTTPERERSTQSPEELRAIIESGKDWLIGTQERNGHFSYEYAPYEDSAIPGDNIVRQAGTLYQLGELARRGDTDPKLKSAIRKSIAYFETLTTNDIADGNQIQCIAYTTEHTSCPLGATSLVLAGILGYLDLYPEDEHVYRHLVSGYLSYILTSQKEQGGFRNVHRIGSRTQPEKESSFSNGEALMALVRYYVRENDKKVKDAIDTSFSYLKETPFDGPLYLWIMAALKDLHKIEPRDEYIKYAKSYTTWRTDGVSRYKTTTKNYCAYAEGIVSAYSILQSSLSESELKALRSEITFWNQKNAALQLTVTDTYRVIDTNGNLSLGMLKNTKRALGGFLTSQEVVTERIDFTQHCVSTYLQTLVDIEGTQL